MKKRLKLSLLLSQFFHHRLSVERDDMEKQITEGENQMRNLAKMKSSLANQLEDMKRLAEGEARDKVGSSSSGLLSDKYFTFSAGLVGGQVQGFRGRTREIERQD